ncbi:PAS and ANTAR domain-containing protein [Mycobacteroides salmoniphilum]|uniref:Putative diguanylate cyclase n=1 Tax=Mycobacteroides salmoniphilum TaxID=404941 RepID=A0A4R8SNQ6_9MYCO|nr:PAS and ANTAR domain-containing protein [Mycobacteroides salmoniphilum]TDZ90657.1 putative diguanylate cyclase [Mycobacteroides salmoniphilum]TEA00601.1 putative diguanylate cyclase [Mycobacteroides salmoniphilum]
MSDELMETAADANLEQALAGGAPQHVGWFRFYFADERWEWSAEVAQMHGYGSEEFTPTTEIVLSHKHPDDFRQVAATLDEIRRTAQPFSTRHRIIDLQQQVHHVVVIGDRLYDDDGTVIGTHGFYVDVTPSAQQDREDSLTAAVVEIAESRGIIEQAKGMLMLIYRLNADTAFELLKWRSQESNVKLRALAQQIVADFQSLDFGKSSPSRSEYDRLLLTTHQRVPR